MASLRVQYLGLDLPNPIVVSSSSLADSPEKVKRCEDAGAGAVVLKSIFEEEIQATINAASDYADHTEAADYLREIQTEAGLKAYAATVRGASEAVSIPVIASINAASRNWWEQYTPMLVEAGAAALELNLSLMPYDYRDDDESVAEFYVSAVQAVRKQVSVPIAVKIGHYFSSIPAIVDRLKWAGADGVVLFNRFYQMDIDIDSLRLKSGSPMSSPSDLAVPIRWITMLSGKTDVDFAASSGVHSGADVVKALLAGAQVAQVCSALYMNGVEHLTGMVEELNGWMDANSFDRVDQFRGKLSQTRSERPERYERLQYVQALTGFS